jgi:hypothetical protein
MFNMKTTMAVVFGLALIIGSITQVDWKNVSFKVTSNDVPVVNYQIIDNKIVPNTILTSDQLKIQDTQGCQASVCHTKF